MSDGQKDHEGDLDGTAKDIAFDLWVGGFSVVR